MGKREAPIIYTDTIKREMARYLETEDRRVLKSEEPGSKKKLAMEYGYTESIQPLEVNPGVYVLTSSIAGIVEKQQVMKHVSSCYDCYEMGRIRQGVQKITFTGRMDWV